MRIAWMASCLTLTSFAAAQTTAWDFEGDETTWRPRMDTVAVEIERGSGATDESTASLHVSGPIEGGWNYAMSDTRPMEPEQLYRLSAWVRVNSLGDGTLAPFLKCEFLGEGTASLGRASTTTYEIGKTGEWQRLTGEFRSPDGVTSFWLAVEKGGSDPMQIDANLDDVTLERIDRLTILDKYKLDPIPAPLEKMRGVHPRIYLTQERAEELRAAIKTTHGSLWDELRGQADSAADNGPPEYKGDDGWSGNEQLWQRSVGNIMPTLAMAWVLSGDQKYLDAAREWALASCGYETWGLGSIDGMDLATGHQLFGLGIVYDWCYDDLGEEARTTIRETLVRRAGAMFEAGSGGKAWWRKSYMQNHLWVNIAGMSVAGFALFDEVEDANYWVGFPLDRFRLTMDALGPDGASHEGVGYWQYGVEYMMKFLHLSGQLLGVDIVGDGQWWPKTAAYYEYLTTPRNAWTSRSSIIDIGDGPRGNWYGPDHILRGLAWEYRDGHAQWFAERVDEANIEAAGARWLNLIWYDPSVVPIPPDDLPTLRHFDDMDIVSARSDWSGDESLVVFKCGPFIGHEAIQEFSYDPGGGHVHPDAGHFLVFGEGEYLIRDDGYRSKWTGQHNTLLVDGRGQLGEGKHWFSGGECLAAKARPKVIAARSTPEIDHIAGDVTDAYPDDIGLKRFERHLVYVKPNVLLVFDDIRAEAGKELELRLHPEAAECEQDGDVFTVTGEQSVMRIESFHADSTSAEMIAGEDRGGGDEFEMLTIRLRHRVGNANAPWRSITAISWAPKGETPPEVTHRLVPGRSTVTVGDHEVSFTWIADEDRVDW